MKKINYESKKGFTLIELMIVIVLIGILSGVVLNVINVRGIRSKARDAQRAADLKKVQTALELYFADNRSYPVSAWGVLSGGAGVGSTLKTGNYISVIPTDPSTNAGTDPCISTNVGYWYIGSLGSYIIATNMEVATSDDSSPCTGLNNWNISKFPGICTPPGNCYGVENPF
jgi:prepilin-type N-terminal cleavage/methylation domain-containing protein